MDPICEQKIAFLQKYIPYLANLIKLLANDSEKEGKLSQMQLLFDLLNKPDNSVQIETLEKCEEVLSRVFGNADEKHDESDIDEGPDQSFPVVAKTLIKCKLLEGTDDSEEQEKTDKDIEVNSQNVNGCFKETKSGDNDNEVSARNEVLSAEEDSQSNFHTTDENLPTEDNSLETDMRNDLNAPQQSEEESSEVIYETEKETSENTECCELITEDTKVKDKATEEEQPKVNSIKGDINEYDTDKITIASTAEQSGDKEEYNSNCFLEDPDYSTSMEALVNSSKGVDYPDIEILKESSLATTECNLENSCPPEEVSSQVDESETFILPDDGESFKKTPEAINEEETEDAANGEDQDEKITPEPQTDLIMQTESEMIPFKIISAESLAIKSVHSLSEKNDYTLLQPIETDKDNESILKDSENQSNDIGKENAENNEDLDPLDLLAGPPENLLEDPKLLPIENGSVNLKHESKDDDDDDVLLIETRSSPICIDSDPEDEEKQKRSLPIVSSKVLQEVQKSDQKLQNLNTRKSTAAVMDTIRNIIKHQNISIRKVSSHKRPKAQRDSCYLLKKDPKALMETINLIDSDSDDEITKKEGTSKTKDDDVIIISSTQPQRKIIPTKKTFSGMPAKQSTRLHGRIMTKPMSKPATAQSNFLNAVNLQPAPKSSSNPATFSAQLSNKKVIIPNAFYGNPTYSRKATSASVVVQDESSSNDSVSRSIGHSSTVSIRQVQDRMLKEWLENFLTNFASPLQLASHACFVLLQRVLKYRFFQRLKETRVHLNTMAKNFVPESMDVQMMLDLRNVFLENDNLTEAGRRFCRFATNDAFGKPVALTTDSRTGKVTCRTRIGSKADATAEIAAHLKAIKANTLSSKASSVPQVPSLNSTVTSSSTTKSTAISSNSLPATPTTAVSNSARRGRKLRKLSDGMLVPDDDDNDYTPYKGELVLEDEVVTERKKSLRTNRTKRKEAGFTYSEDHDDEEFEALAKKIENKKMEELRLAEERELEKERERERKLKKTVAKKTTSKRQANAVSAHIDVPREPTRKKLRLADTEILGNADDDLLTPTWIEADADDGEVDSLLDFAEEPQSPEPHASEIDNNPTEDDQVANATEDSEDIHSYPASFDVGTNKVLKNTDRALHSRCQSFDFCVHCLRRVPRTVHHYVNEHRSSEVFTSRLRSKDIRRLLTTSNVGFVHLYKGNQQQYAAHCIFCDKEVKFLLPYWFEHFTMHTGEYSFKCSGCHILKPTRSLLTNHLQSGSGCPKKGAAVRLHSFDTKSNQIEAHICAICNYIQVHRKNVLRHLRTQHGVETVSTNHIIKVVLLQVSGPYRDQDTIKNDESQLSLLQHSDEEGDNINGSSFVDENSLMMQNDFTDNDDLSFMICGMLDVQTNLSATPDLAENVDKINIVDNK